MDEKPVIYFLEGFWRDDEQDCRSHDWSVEPMLRIVEVTEQWSYRHRDVATKAVLKIYLRNEWSRCNYGSTLCIATHRIPSTTYLHQEDEQGVSLDKLASIVEKTGDGCEKCHVHFGGCAAVSEDDERTQRFKDRTEAAAVSRFKRIEAVMGKRSNDCKFQFVA